MAPFFLYPYDLNDVIMACVLAQIQVIPMRWSEVRKDYPNMWVVIETMSSHVKDNEETIEEVTVVNSFKESNEAYQNYRKIHKQEPQRDYLFASTANKELKVKIQYWAGVRGKT